MRVAVMEPPSARTGAVVVGPEDVPHPPPGVHLEDDAGVRRPDEAPRAAALGLATIYLALIVRVLGDSSGLDAAGVISNMAMFTVAWTVGIALRARRETLEERVRVADERANLERQSAARALAEERLRLAQDLH